jgi:glutaconate CoA-transferase subunit B
MAQKMKVTYGALACYSAAREIRDGDVVFAGQGWPIVAAALALKFHAPNAKVLMEGGILVDEFLRPPVDVADSTCSMKCPFFSDFADTFTCILYKGYIDVGFVGAAQIDKYGNVNSTAVGDYYKPDFRISGTGGAFEIGCFSKRTILMLFHGNFVEKLDYLSTPGYLDGYESRYEAGLPQDTGPGVVITTKGVFRFDKVTKELYLESYYPKVTIEEIKKDIPWDLKVSPDVTQAPIPSEEEMEFMTNFAPDIILGRAFARQVYVANIMEFVTAKQK